MRALSFLLLALSTAGCFSAPFHPARTCSIGGVTVELEKDRECADIEALVRGAVALDVEHGFVSGEEASGLELELWIHDEGPTVLCSDGAWAAGCTEEWPGRAQIQLSRSGAALAHELLHHVSHLRGVSDEDNARHAGWETKGAPERALSYEQEGRTVLEGSWLDVTQRWYFAVDGAVAR